jgi:hypothetical protein
VKLLRDLSGADLAKALSKVGYKVTRQTGTLSAILGDASSHLQIERDELLRRLFG